MKRQAVLGIDSSTQSTKALLVELESGEILWQGRAPHSGASVQHPNDWWEALGKAVSILPWDEVELKGVSVAAQQHGLVSMDVDRNPVRPAPLWNNVDAAVDAARLNDEADFASLTGSRLVAAFTIAKLAHFQRTDPDGFAMTDVVGLPHDWLNHRLTGRLSTDRGDASGTGWWSPLQERFMPELFTVAVGERDAERLQVSPVLDPAARVGKITESASAQTGIPAGVPVAIGTGDNMGAALGIGLEPGEFAISLGTSGTAFGVSCRPTIDPSGEVAGFADASGRYLPLVCFLNCTRVMNLVADLLGIELEAALELAHQTEPGAGGLLMTPHFDGERTPNLPDATGSLLGMTTQGMTQSNLARAALDGVAAGIALGIDALRNQGIDGNHIELVGGGSVSLAWQQAIADASELPVVAREGVEYVAKGAAIQAAALARGETLVELARMWRPIVKAQIEPRNGLREAFRLPERRAMHRN